MKVRNNSKTTSCRKTVAHFTIRNAENDGANNTGHEVTNKKRSDAFKTQAIKVATNNLLIPVKLAKFTLRKAKTLERIT